MNIIMQRHTYVAKYNIAFGVIYKMYFLTITHFLAFKNTQSRIVAFKYSIFEAKLYIIPQREREHEISVILHEAGNQIKWCLAIRSLLQISAP